MIDVGDGHSIRLEDGGAFWIHDHAGRSCERFIPLTRYARHHVASEDPLSIEPVVVCSLTEPVVMGHIAEGRWKPL